MMQQTSLGERILILRRRNRLTCRELARRAGCSASTISRIERGMEPEFKHVIAIALALKMDTRFLLKGVNLKQDLAIWKGDIRGEETSTD